MSYLSYTKPFNNNLLQLLLRDHKRYMPIIEFFESMTNKLSEISWAEAELIAAEISKINQSEFCSGLREGMVNALDADRHRLKDNKLAAALFFALKVNQNPELVSQQDVNTVTAAGWSEQTVEDLVCLVGIQSLYNIIGTALGFKKLPDEVFYEIGKDTVKKGYIKSFEQHLDAI